MLGTIRSGGIRSVDRHHTAALDQVVLDNKGGNDDNSDIEKDYSSSDPFQGIRTNSNDLDDTNSLLDQSVDIESSTEMELVLFVYALLFATFLVILLRSHRLREILANRDITDLQLQLQASSDDRNNELSSIYLSYQYQQARESPSRSNLSSSKARESPSRMV